MTRSIEDQTQSNCCGDCCGGDCDSSTGDCCGSCRAEQTNCPDEGEAKKSDSLLHQLFDGEAFDTFLYKNRPCWIANQVGRALQYSGNGERLVSYISGEWTQDFIEGRDFAILTGKELAEFKAILEQITSHGGSSDVVDKYTSRLFILFETGLFRALLRTKKPVGKRLRRFIADQVAPQIPLVETLLLQQRGRDEHPNQNNGEKKMTDIVKLHQKFEGKPLTTFFYKDQPCWVAREVGRALKYSTDGERFVNNITGVWSDEMVEGHDYVVLTGPELADFKALCDSPSNNAGLKDLIGSRGVWRLLLLFESGLNLALNKTNKPVGRKLRRFFADEVMPQLNRDGAYLPERRVEGNKIVQDDNKSVAMRRLAVAESREARLDRDLKAKALKDLVGILNKAGCYSEDTIRTYEIASVEAAAGQDFSTLKPEIVEVWMSPSQIGDEVGMTAQQVGYVIKDLGLKRHPVMCKAINNVAPKTHRQLETFLYNAEGVRLIKAEIERRRRNAN